MDDNITLAKSAFVELLETAALGAGALLNPDPDDPGPTGPGAPVIRRWERVSLNPQPLPPRLTHSLGQIAWGPRPEPWRSAGFAAGEVARLVDQVDAATIGGVDGRGVAQRGGTALAALVDDWCATPYRRWPGPNPKHVPGQAQSLHPVNLIFAGAQLHRSAEAFEDHLLQGALAEAADRLIRTGLDRLSDQAGQVTVGRVQITAT
jgi:hypothetical protein